MMATSRSKMKDEDDDAVSANFEGWRGWIKCPLILSPVR
jgi:hypothetical protein